MRSVRRILRSKRGETLMEGIVSILIFTILMAAVTLMLNWAQRETGNTIREGQNLQVLADKALLNDYTDFAGTPENPDYTPQTGNFTLTITGINGAAPVSPIPAITIPVTTTDFNNDEFVAFFAPSPSPSLPPGSGDDP